MRPAQAAAATTAILPGVGAILAPSMSGPNSEPQALVFRGGEPVASGPTGARSGRSPLRLRPRTGTAGTLRFSSDRASSRKRAGLAQPGDALARPSHGF